MDKTKQFSELVDSIAHIGHDYHAQVLIKHARENQPFIKKSIRELAPLNEIKCQSAIVISAGPSVHRRKSIQSIKDSGFTGTLIAADGAYVACLKAGLTPDYMVTLDPHHTRVVRWFGDPDIIKNAVGDDYYERQDLDIEFRKNRLAQNENNIALVNAHAAKTKAIVCVASHPSTVVKRLGSAGFDLHWWNPLCDDPTNPAGLTRTLYNINKLPCLNTGGTVGTAAWVFASDFLKIKNIAVVGMDYGYYYDTPIEQTQTYYELINRLGPDVDLSQYFVPYTFPLTGEKFYTDATYYWYKNNFLELVEQSRSVTVNCTEGGTLIDKRIKNIFLNQFLGDFK